jgi:hypothetical protein
MKKFVFWTGVYNIVFGFGFLLPPMIDILQVPAPNARVWVQLPAIIVIYLGILLLLCSKNLRPRASIVYWEGILRIILFFLLAGYGLFGGLGIAMVIVGIGDLVIGLVFVFGLPRSLGVTAGQLITDNV